MKGTFQGQDEITIKASTNKIWGILIDGTQLSQWMKVVQHTTSVTEHLNAVRSCEVAMNGKKGQVRERCILFEEQKEIAWQMEYDEFGFSRMFDNYSFSFELQAIDDQKTRVINKGFYDAKNIWVRWLNVLMFRSMSSKIRCKALLGIKALAEK